MTTLPQTSGVRLPRPVGVPSSAMAGAIGGGHAPATGIGGGMTPADIWRVIRANMLLIIISVVGSIILGFVLNSLLLKYYSRYTATGLIAIDLRGRFNPLEKQSDYVDTSGLPIEQRTQSSILTSDSLYGSVLSDPNSDIRKTGWAQTFMLAKAANAATQDNFDVAGARAALTRGFAASPIVDSKLIRVDMTCSDPDDARRIVEAVVNKHLQEQDVLAQGRMVSRGQTLNNLKYKEEQHLQELTARRNNRIQQLGVNSISGGGRLTESDLQLSSTINHQIELTTAAAAADQMYKSIKSQIDGGFDPPTVDDMVERDPTVAGYKSSVVGWDAEIAAAFALGNDAQHLKELQAKREVFQKEYEDERAQKRITARNTILDSARSNAQAAQDALSTTTERVKQLRDTSSEMSIAMSDYLTINDEINSVNEQLKSIREQLDSISASNSTSTVDWARRPETPDTPSFPKLALTLSVMLFLGLALSMGIAFLREMMDTSVRSPRDIARVGAMNLLGMIPHEDDDPQSAGVPLPMVIFQAPTSIMAEQYRQVRTRLQHAASLDTTRSIMVTSPAPGDGKTIVACNLAAGLALNGRKILLVDANFRRPELNKAFNVANDVGFSNALASLDNFDSAIRSTQVPNLDVMTTGLKPANPAELMESQLFTDFIDRALEEYDHVIFDTGPMLLVSETGAMAPRVDGVVTVVRAASNSRGLLQRLRDALRQVKAEHLGIVLNGVRAQGGGYYGRNIKAYYEYQNGHAA